MTDDKKRRLKKFFHDYAVAIVTTALLFVVLILLLISRHTSLISVQDLSKINPLITSEQNTLIAANDTNEIVKIPIDENQAKTQQPANSFGSKPSSPKNNQSQKPSSGSSNNSGSSSGGTSGGGSSTPPDSKPISQPFAVGIGSLSIRSTANKSGLILPSCQSTTHTINAELNADNAPGTVTYRWKRSDGFVGNTLTLEFNANENTKYVPFSWTISKNSQTNNDTVTLEVLTPTGKQKTTEHLKSKC